MPNSVDELHWASTSQDQVNEAVVVGAGQIGRTVAHAFAERCRVILVDRNPAALRDALQTIRRAHLARLLQRTAAVPLDDLLDRLTLSEDLTEVGRASLVVENITEDPDAKIRVHRDLDAVCPPGTVVAANTSAIPIGFLAQAHRHPERLVGAHFMIPATHVKGVELIAAEHTAPEIITRAEGMLRHLGFAPTTVADGPGFVSNRLLMLLVNEASALVREGVASAEAIDAVLTSCAGHRMGILATADLIGLDTVVRSLDVLHRFTSADHFRADPLLRDLVDAGRCGRKSGVGFHRYGQSA